MKRESKCGRYLLQRVEAGFALPAFDHGNKACIDRDPLCELPLRYIGESSRSSDCFRIIHYAPKFLEVSFPWNSSTRRQVAAAKLAHEVLDDRLGHLPHHPENFSSGRIRFVP
jgi:hypothetical protein